VKIRDHYYKMDGLPLGESGFWFLWFRMVSASGAQEDPFTRAIRVTLRMSVDLIYSREGIPSRVYFEEVLRKQGSGFWLPFAKGIRETLLREMLKTQSLDIPVLIPSVLLMAEDAEAIDLHAGYQVDEALRRSGVLDRAGCSVREMIGDILQCVKKVENDFLDGHIFFLPLDADIRTKDILNFIIQRWHTRPIFYDGSANIRVEEGSLVIPGTLEDPFENYSGPGGCLSQAVAFGALPAPWCLLKTTPTALTQQSNNRYTFVSNAGGTTCAHPVGVKLPEDKESFLQKVELLASLLIGNRAHEACVPV